MPKIREYENPIDSLRPSDKAESAWAQTGNVQARLSHQIADMNTAAGRAIGGAISQIGPVAQEAYEKYQVQTEISKGSASVAVQVDALTQNWNKQASGTDPNDTSIAQRFREKTLTPALQKWREQFTTREGGLWADKQVNQITEHFFVKTLADTSTRAGQATLQNIEVMKNGWVNTVANDPTSLDIALASTSDAVKGQIMANPMISATLGGKLVTETTQKINAELVKHGILSMIERDPEAGLKVASSGKYAQYIDGPDMKQFGAYAETVNRMREAAAKAQDTFEKQVQTEKNKASVTENVRTNVTVEPNGMMRIRPEYFAGVLELAKDPKMDPALIKSAWEFGRALGNEYEKGITPVTNPTVHADFGSRMFLPESDPRHLSLQEVYNARAQQQLDNKDFEFFTKAVNVDIKNPQLVADRKEFDAFTKAYKGYITKSTMFAPDATGDQRAYEFERNKWAVFQAARSTGKSVDALLNPASPDFIGKDINKYQLPFEDTLRNVIDKATGKLTPSPAVNLPKRTPGESLDAYEKRLTGGQ